MTDDIDDSEEDVSTIRFALDKQEFEIDLSAANADFRAGESELTAVAAESQIG